MSHIGAAREKWTWGVCLLLSKPFSHQHNWRIPDHHKSFLLLKQKRILFWRWPVYSDLENLPTLRPAVMCCYDGEHNTRNWLEKIIWVRLDKYTCRSNYHHLIQKGLQLFIFISPSHFIFNSPYSRGMEDSRFTLGCVCVWLRYGAAACPAL